MLVTEPDVRYVREILVTQPRRRQQSPSGIEDSTLKPWIGDQPYALGLHNDGRMIHPRETHQDQYIVRRERTSR